MGRLGRSVRHGLLGINDREIQFDSRGFSRRHPRHVAHLEDVGYSFVKGYRMALDDPEASVIADLIVQEVCEENRGFAYEGAAMALALLDFLSPWQSGRFQELIDGPGSAHAYMVHIGAGWALARIRQPLMRYLRKFDPLLCWLVLDGYGFHEGYFHTHRTVEDFRQPRSIRGYACAAFDSGLGRSLWFIYCADPDDVAHCIKRFPASRHANLWAGTGLACSYAGGFELGAVERLIELAGDHRDSLAQGAAFAAKARERASIPAAHTELAVGAICNVTAEESCICLR